MPAPERAPPGLPSTGRASRPPPPTGPSTDPRLRLQVKDPDPDAVDPDEWRRFFEQVLVQLLLGKLEIAI